jgi:hypothetical protein
MATAEEILSAQIPEPIVSLRPNPKGPIDIDGFQRNSNARQWNPAKGQFEQVSSGKPCHGYDLETGEYRGFMVENRNENVIKRSSFQSAGGSATKATGLTGVIEGVSAPVYDNGDVERFPGSFTNNGGGETVYFILEEGTDPEPTVQIRESGTYNDTLGEITYEWGNGITNTQGNELAVNTYEIFGEYKNGGELRMFEIYYDPTDSGYPNNYVGETRHVRLITSNGTTIVHHVQLSPNLNAQNPVPTENVSGTATPPASGGELPVPNWPGEGTIVIESSLPSLGAEPYPRIYDNTNGSISGNVRYRGGINKGVVINDPDNLSIFEFDTSYTSVRTVLGVTKSGVKSYVNGELKYSKNNGHWSADSIGNLILGGANNEQINFREVTVYGKRLDDSTLEILSQKI